MNTSDMSFDDLIQMYGKLDASGSLLEDSIPVTEKKERHQRPSDQFSRSNYYKQDSKYAENSDLSDLLSRFSTRNTISGYNTNTFPLTEEKRNTAKFEYDSDISSDLSSDEESVESGFDVKLKNNVSHLRPTRTARHSRLERYFESIENPVRRHMDKEKEQLMDKKNEKKYHSINHVPVGPKLKRRTIQAPSDINDLYSRPDDLVRLPRLNLVENESEPSKGSGDNLKKKSKSSSKKKKAKKVKSDETLLNHGPPEILSKEMTKIHISDVLNIDSDEQATEKSTKKKKSKQGKKEKHKKPKDMIVEYCAPQAMSLSHSVHSPLSNRNSISQWDSASQIGSPSNSMFYNTHPNRRSMGPPNYNYGFTSYVIYPEQIRK